MSDDPIISQLSKFTPDGAGLDRDAILFAAGKASARPSRRPFMLISSVAYALALSQIVTLGFLLSGRAERLFVSDEPQKQFSTAAQNMKWMQPTPQANVETPRPDPASYLVLREQLLSADGLLPPREPIDSAVPDEPPLHAFGPLPFELFN